MTQTKKRRRYLQWLAVEEAIPVTIVSTITDDDIDIVWDQIGEYKSRDFFAAFLGAVEDEEARKHGQRPRHDHKPAICTHCGPIWTNGEDDGQPCQAWPVYHGCPWCHIKGVAIPRPLVPIGECRHYHPDKHNPKAGLGDCQCQSAYPKNNVLCSMFEPQRTED